MNFKNSPETYKYYIVIVCLLFANGNLVLANSLKNKESIRNLDVRRKLESPEQGGKSMSWGIIFLWYFIIQAVLSVIIFECAMCKTRRHRDGND